MSLRACSEDLLFWAGGELVHVGLQRWIIHLTFQASDETASLEGRVETIRAWAVESQP